MITYKLKGFDYEIWIDRYMLGRFKCIGKEWLYVHPRNGVPITWKHLEIISRDLRTLNAVGEI